MKKIGLSVLLCTMIMFVMLIVAPCVNAKEKVKVYMFEAGECPYCEQEVEYLEGLSSYGEKFELIRKELYVDHVDWAQGEDYELGKKVSELFKSKGFDDADYDGTPFIVISNVYAKTGYSDSLESYIEKAYEKGDQDVVGCVINGGENCLVIEKGKYDTIIIIGIFVVLIGGSAALILTGRKNS